jgi:hypothetical protein
VVHAIEPLVLDNVIASTRVTLFEGAKCGVIALLLLITHCGGLGKIQSSDQMSSSVLDPSTRQQLSSLVVKSNGNKVTHGDLTNAWQETCFRRKYFELALIKQQEKRSRVAGRAEFLSYYWGEVYFQAKKVGSWHLPFRSESLRNIEPLNKACIS